MAQQLSLESFEQCFDEPTASSAEYSTGYEDGIAAATAAFQADQQTLNETLVQAISDMTFSYAEARGQLLETLAPLFRTVVQKLLPRISQESFGPLLIEAIIDAAARDTAKPPVLHIHPSQQRSIESLVQAHGINIVTFNDPALSEHAAWICLEHGETYLDVDSLLTNIGETLDAISAFQSEDGTP